MILPGQLLRLDNQSGSRLSSSEAGCDNFVDSTDLADCRAGSRKFNPKCRLDACEDEQQRC